MEAMAARVPVVTTRIAGVPELVEDGVSGLLVPPGDAHALQVAIGRLLYDAHLCRDMGEAGRLRVAAEFSSDSEAAWLAALFEGYGTGVPPKSLRPKDSP
jgi:glycosyltransferase involved in cell wall biosynthesis